MQRMRSVSALLAVTCLAAGLLSPPRAAAKEVGLAVGEVAPKLSLVDQRGATHSLETLLGHGTLAIVFFRSADW